MRRPACPVAALLLALFACNAAERRPDHVVLVTVDTLRADRIGAYGYARADTPHLDALASGSVRFERAYAHASITLPSIASLMTGLLPSRHRLFANFARLPPRHATLATRLEEAGFVSGAFLGSYALRPARGLARGFHRYTEEYSDRELNRRSFPENRGGALTDEAIAWIDRLRSGQRFFLWIHYQEPHGPYTPPDHPPAPDGGLELPRSDDQSGRGAIPSYQWLGHGRLSEYEARYDGEIREVDRQVGRLVEALRARGLFERSLFVFTADHGEAFGEADLYCAHGEGLHEALLRVPLLLRVPGVVPAVRSDAVRLIDVAPTVLAALGIPHEDLPGHSLLDDLGDRPVAAQIVAAGNRRYRSLREAGYELLETPEATRLRPLDAAGPADPPPAARDRLAARLEALAPWPERDRPPPRLTLEERQALRRLGYVE